LLLRTRNTPQPPLAHRSSRRPFRTKHVGMRTFTPVLLAALFYFSNSARAQQEPSCAPTAAPAPSISSGQPAGSSRSSSSRSKKKPVPSFLIVGTVFDEKALSLPGVRVRVRQDGEKKFRWETYTNSRGEFAVRVPPGHDYEVVTHMKDYQDRSQNIDSKVDVQHRLSIKLEPRSESKTGTKP
jgi:hypothetical protein